MTLQKAISGVIKCPESEYGPKNRYRTYSSLSISTSSKVPVFANYKICTEYGPNYSKYGAFFSIHVKN